MSRHSEGNGWLRMLSRRRFLRNPNMPVPNACPRSGSTALFEPREQLVVGLVFLERGGEGFPRFDGIQVHHRATQFADSFKIFWREKFFLLARATLANVNAREQPPVGQ